MRVLSLTQPWATLVSIHQKRYETRSWSTPHKGPLAIAAAKGFPKDEQRLCLEAPFSTVLHAAGFRTINDLKAECGHIIAIAELVCCTKTYGEVPKRADGLFSETVPPAEHELDFGNYSEGRFAWMMKNVRRLTKKLPAKGMLGLWEFPDADIEAAL